jgi:hypothetical protein
LNQIIASAAKFLIEGEEFEAASVLLACQPDSISIDETAFGEDEEFSGISILLRGPRSVCDLMADKESSYRTAIKRALNAVLPVNEYLSRVWVRAELVTLSPGWKEELTNLARGRMITNQGIVREGDTTRIWKGLRFRSATEVRIADALDQAEVFFLPNCLGRLSAEDGSRANREADFLVCHRGHWGILEIDGEPFHPAARAAEDHKRDRLFRLHGIRVVERFSATECYEQPEAVVSRFLAVLAKTYAS